MSYNIAVVVPPLPVTDADAWNAVDSLIEQQGSPPAIFRELHDRLTARFPCLSSLPDDQIDDGAWSDGPLWNNFGHRAAVLGMSYSRVDDVLPFLIETANSLNLAVFDWATEQIHRADGIKGLTLTVEGQSAITAPTLKQLKAAVDRLTPRGGPGFLVLDGPNQNYAQLAGGDGVYTVEWREYQGNAFQHWVAGLRGLPSRKEVAVPTNGFVVTVLENERLSADNVKTILTAFAEGRGRREEFTWRDITDRFA